ncbi:8319_t:CDS:2 [Acaulospora morrowiae]|uniref:8319_t:CDS:1 n=1 Tax=Acaulospora morrowiae TaxID=94023 RepID=A0A9N9BQC0_9GLOM|nr:8319_t:CDS:2 [Acaulospora morrowiae]
MGGAQSSAKGHGYHVLRVQENSPSQQAGIESFFDYIVGINGIPLDSEAPILQEQLLLNVDKEVVLLVYSTKEQVYREVFLTPSKNWTKDSENGLIVFDIAYTRQVQSINEHVWHILDISPNSPAEMAGLHPSTDYIIGTPHETLRSENDLYDLIDDYLGKPLRLYVYNSNFDVCREVIIVPNQEWGGEGSLGCGVGYGYLHRIPKTHKHQPLRKNFESMWKLSSFPLLGFTSDPVSPQLNADDSDAVPSTFVPFDSNITASTSIIQPYHLNQQSGEGTKQGPIESGNLEKPPPNETVLKNVDEISEHDKSISGNEEKVPDKEES